MAKRQNFIVGSTNPITASKTATELNEAWDRLDVLDAEDLDGVFNAVSDYSNDSSNEIANAIQSITGSQPTGANQSELAGALSQLREEIETTSLTFKGYISTSAPDSSVYALIEGNIWINSATLPTSFPVAASDIKVWDGTNWVNSSSSYTVKDFDFFRNINDGEGYYWFGGQWTVMSTDMDTTYFKLNQSGKWTINDTMKNISNWSSNVTNCITNIPQDIKLELNAGVLTLKAGSKVYVPNGFEQDGTTKKFDTYVVQSDFLLTPAASYGQYFEILFTNGSLSNRNSLITTTYSGSTAPTGSTYMVWYDTTNNIIKYTNDGGSTWVSSDGLSLPICAATCGVSKFISADQIFNGFGYIGSTVFALSGGMGLSPNYRNSDGTLKSTIVTVPSVTTHTASGSGYGLTYMLNSSGGIEGVNSNAYSEGSKPTWFDGGLNATWFDTERNVIARTTDTTNWIDGQYVVFGSMYMTNAGQLDWFRKKETFRALDHNDVSSILGVLYPIGSIYIGTQDDCPLKILIPGSRWVTIQGRYLLASGTLAGTTNEHYNATDTVASGLPNITSTSSDVLDGIAGNSSWSNGAITYTKLNTHAQGGGNAIGMGSLSFNATNANSIYGQSSAVRAPAYVVKVWRRVS